MLCWKCGKEVTEDFLFCPTCGKAQLSPEEANTLGLAHLLSQLLSRRVSVADRNKSEQFVRQICGQDWKLQEEQGKLLCVLENHFHVDLTSPTPEPPPQALAASPVTIPPINLDELRKRYQNRPFLKISELAKLLGLEYKAVWGIVRQEVFGAKKVGGSWRIPIEGIINYFAAQEKEA